jgi:hypothetical protein
VIRASSSTPQTVRQIAPRPPSTLVPPTTTAAKANKTIPSPSSAWPCAVRDATSAPAIPAANPAATNAAALTARTSIPDIRAASELPPTANSQRPNFVRHSTNPHTSATAAKR